MNILQVKKYYLQIRVIEQVKFSYYPLGKALKKQIKIIDDQREEQVEPLKVLKPADHKQKPKSIEGVFSKDLEVNEIKNELKN